MTLFELFLLVGTTVFGLVDRDNPVSETFERWRVHESRRTGGARSTLPEGHPVAVFGRVDGEGRGGDGIVVLRPEQQARRDQNGERPRQPAADRSAAANEDHGVGGTHPTARVYGGGERRVGRGTGAAMVGDVSPANGTEDCARMNRETG